MKFIVKIGRLVREEAEVVVEADSIDDVKNMTDAIYEDYDGEWTPDTQWGCSESDSHTVSELPQGSTDKPQYSIRESDEEDEEGLCLYSENKGNG